MGAGGKEVSLDVFESHLKKLLHIIDKLPKVEREKAVLILRNSANHYSNLTSGHPLPPPAPCPPVIFSNILPCNQALSEIPVSQVAKTFDLLKDENLMKQPVSDVVVNSSTNSTSSTSHGEIKSESQAILDEIGGLGDDGHGGPGSYMEDGEDWDQHILDLDDPDRLNALSSSAGAGAADQTDRLDPMETEQHVAARPDRDATIVAEQQEQPMETSSADHHHQHHQHQHSNRNSSNNNPQPPATSQNLPHMHQGEQPPSQRQSTDFMDSMNMNKLIGDGGGGGGGDVVVVEPSVIGVRRGAEGPLNPVAAHQPPPGLLGGGDLLVDQSVGGGGVHQVLVGDGGLQEANLPQCKLCFKRLDSRKHPMSCRSCRTVLCDTECFLIHSQECSPASKQLSRSVGRSKKKVKKKQEYKCEECDKFFLTNITLKRHMEGHSKNDCDRCPAKFAKRRLLVCHLRQAHGIEMAEKYYPCKFCPRKFVKKPSLWFHYTCHTTGTQMVCLKCGEIVENKELLEKHRDKHKASEYTCNLCGDFFARRQQYNLHIKSHDNYNCGLCGKSFASKKRLKQHTNKDHEHETSGGGGKVYTVDNGKTAVANAASKTAAAASAAAAAAAATAMKKTVVNQTQIKNWKKSFKCGFCNFENKNYKKVVRHERRHKNFRKFVCELCGNAFNSEYTLKEHTMYVHSDERNFKCLKCDKTFKAKNALIRHEQVHTDQRSYHCHCGKSYKRQSHLNRHFAASSHGYTANAAPSNSALPKAEFPSVTQTNTWSVPVSASADKKVLDPAGSEADRQMRIEVKSAESLSACPSLDQSPAYTKPADRDSKRDVYDPKTANFDKLKHYRIPKKYSSPQKFNFGPEKPTRSYGGELALDPARNDYGNRLGHGQYHNAGKHQYNLPSVTGKSHYPTQHPPPQRHYPPPPPDPADRGGGHAMDRFGLGNLDKITNEIRDYIDRCPPVGGKLDYPGPLGEKSYQDFGDDKAYVIPDVLDERQLPHPEDKLYSIGDDRQQSTLGTASLSEKSFLSLDDRLFHGAGRDSGYSQGPTSSDSRMLAGPNQDLRLLGSNHDSRFTGSSQDSRLIGSSFEPSGRLNGSSQDARYLNLNQDPRHFSNSHGSRHQGNSSHQDSRHVGSGQDGRHFNSNQDSKIFSTSQDSRHFSSGQEVRHSAPSQESRLHTASQDSRHFPSGQDSRLLGTSQDSRHLAANQDSRLLSSNQDSRLLSSSQDSRNLASIQESRHYASSQDSRVLGSNSDSRHISAAGQDSRHLTSSQDSRHLSSSQDARLLSSNQDSRHMSSSQDSRHLSSSQDSRHLSSTQDSRLIGSNQDSRNIGLGQDSRLMTSSQDSRLLGPGQDSRLLGSGQDSRLLSSSQDSRLLGSSQDSRLTTSSQDSRLISSNQDTRLLGSSQDLRPVGGNQDSRLPLPGQGTGQDSRSMGPAQIFFDSVFPDSGPADLTVTSKESSSRSDARAANDYFLGLYPQLSRHSFTKPRPPSPNATSSSRSYASESSNRTIYPSSSQRSQSDIYRSAAAADILRPTHGSDSRPLPPAGISCLDDIEDSSYRSIQDPAAYPRQQNPYLDQIDPYVLLARPVDFDDNYEKRHKYYRQEKYSTSSSRTEDLNHSSSRQEGGVNLLGPKQDNLLGSRNDSGGGGGHLNSRQDNAGGGGGHFNSRLDSAGGHLNGRQDGMNVCLLPPLLALNPSLPGSSHNNGGPPSPNIKLDYISDHIGSQYIAESALDYY